MKIPRWSLLGCAVLVATSGFPLLAGWSHDEPPSESGFDPGDMFFVGGALEVNDACPAIPPFPLPCLGVPDEDNFDLDGFSIEVGSEVCPQLPVQHVPGILFSIDHGDPGALSGPPNEAVELLFYDRCGVFAGGSYVTNGTESLLGLGSNPPPVPNDDDADAYEARSVATEWDNGFRVLFTADTPSTGGLPASAFPPCSSPPEANLFASDMSGTVSALAYTACDLGVPDTEDCDIDAITVVLGEDGGAARGALQILFSTDALHPCGLDPGDIYISNLSGSMALWADDVTDLQIARSEDVDVDLDALSVNAPGPINPTDVPFEPDSGIFVKRSYPDYAPSGIPDFSQDHFAFPPTYCGPTALADCFWWFDSKFEGFCPGGFPGDGHDDFPLVEAFGLSSDDHVPANVEPLIGALATAVNTDGLGPGSGTLFIPDFVAGADLWLDGKGLLDDFTRTAVVDPTFDDIACEVEKSENVILLLGFWWFQPAGGSWFKCGGHYVTAAGVQRTREVGPDGQPGVASFDDDFDGVVDERDELCPCTPGAGITVHGDDICAGPLDRILISDPGKNNAEAPPDGTGGPGQVLGPAHASHAPVAAPPPDHDDARNVSHDLYDVGPSLSTFNRISLLGYGTSSPGSPTDCTDILRWCDQNPVDIDDLLVPCPGTGVTVSVEVEAILAISPVTCDLCLDAQGGPGRFLVHKGTCPSPASHPITYDFIRGELCQLSESVAAVDLGLVDCLESDTPVDQYLDSTTPIITRGIGAWFFLPREDPPNTYGTSSLGNPRFPSGGDCP